MRPFHLPSVPAARPASRRWRMLAALPLLVLLAAWQSTSWSQDAYQQGEPPDPPGQVARLNLAQGPVSFAPADAVGSTDGKAWTTALLNRPLTRGDRLWTGPNARAELHAGSTAVRMSEETSLDFLALDDSVTQLRLAQGTVQLRVRALFEGQRLEIDTPNLAFVISQPGDYRLDVNPASDTTRVVAQAGGGTIYGDGGVSLALGSQQQGNFSGAGLTPATPGATLQDSFDAWAAERDRREDQSVSARYIPRETIGYQQLDGYGDWQQDPAYGAVWLPRAVPVDWAPYRAGHWSWISPWGWTWVDDAPWGFAPFHYGRWALIGPRWAWVPGQLPQRPVYAPALVAFVGGGNWRGAAGPGGVARPALGWFPLAPGEAFRPAYRSSPSYVSRVNNNITVNNTVNTNNFYRYQQQPAAVTALSRDDFARGRQVQGRPHTPSATDLSGAQVLIDQAVMPQRPDLRERPRPAPAAMPPAALPPAALATQAVVRSQGERSSRIQAPPPVAPAVPPPVAPAVPAPAATAAVAAQSQAARTTPVLAPERSPVDAEQRARRDQQFLQREQERQHQELQRHLQRQQQQQSGLARQQDLQRRQGEAAMLQQRAMQEQAHRQQELLREQAHAQQRRQGEEALNRQRAQQEQARQQAQQQRAIAQNQPRTSRRRARQKWFIAVARRRMADRSATGSREQARALPRAGLAMFSIAPQANRMCATAGFSPVFSLSSRARAGRYGKLPKGLTL